MRTVMLLLGLMAAIPAALRFLRVAQREHYLPGSTTRFAVRWWTVSPINLVMALVAIGGIAFSPMWWWTALLPITASTVGPLGLSVRGSSSPLAWTSRLRRLSGITVGLVGIGLVATYLLDAAAPAGGMLAFGFPLLLDLGLAIAGPVEKKLGKRWVDKAKDKLATISPRVVAITGSYGKTTTKEYLRLLLEGETQVVASPASFNNAMGLARTVNEHLAVGTDVFVAEMGTYGPGEIAELCSWIPPEISVITAIGPVHLERFGSLDTTLAAKAEILEGARVAVLNVDDPRLRVLADEQAEIRQVVRCSAVDTDESVCVLDGESGQEVWVAGERVGLLHPPVAFATNVACAIGAALAVGVSADSVERRLAGAGRPAHRQTLSESELGFTIIDDTYNSNPAGAAAGLELLRELGAGGRRVLVTPGMVELGFDQQNANRRMAAEAAGVATDVIIVGRTNRKPLLAGTSEGSASVMVVDSRPAAVDWVRKNLGRGDVVLYENDLPDHYP